MRVIPISASISFVEAEKVFCRGGSDKLRGVWSQKAPAWARAVNGCELPGYGREASLLCGFWRDDEELVVNGREYIAGRLIIIVLQEALRGFKVFNHLVHFTKAMFTAVDEVI